YQSGDESLSSFALGDPWVGVRVALFPPRSSGFSLASVNAVTVPMPGERAFGSGGGLRYDTEVAMGYDWGVVSVGADFGLRFQPDLGSELVRQGDELRWAAGIKTQPFEGWAAALEYRGATTIAEPLDISAAAGQLTTVLRWNDTSGVFVSG